MKFPFVSRERLSEAQAEVTRLRDELAKERERNQKLWNFLNWRVGGGVAFDTSMLPEPYQPRVGGPTQKTEDAAAQVLRNVRAPGQARRDLAKFEVQQQQDFDRTKGIRVAEEPAKAEEPQSKAGD